MNPRLRPAPRCRIPPRFKTLAHVAREYKLLDRLPASIREVFEKNALRETPKQGDPAFARAIFSILLGAHDLSHAAHHACEAEGYVCLFDHSTDNWPIEKAADYLLALLERHRSDNPGKPVAVLADGEVSSPVTGNGIGGRNSAFVLACVPKIAGKKITVFSAGTDGIDGNSPGSRSNCGWRDAVSRAFAGA